MICDAIDDWYISGQYEELMEEEEQVEILRTKIKDIVEENKQLQVNTLCPMQLMSQMNEVLSKESSLLGQVLYIKGVYKCGNNVLYNNYFYDSLKDENSPT